MPEMSKPVSYEDEKAMRLFMKLYRHDGPVPHTEAIGLVRRAIEEVIRDVKADCRHMHTDAHAEINRLTAKAGALIDHWELMPRDEQQTARLAYPTLARRLDELMRVATSDDEDEPTPAQLQPCGGYYCSEEHGHVDCGSAERT